MSAPSQRHICRGCGCTDDRACPGGCAWALMDFEIHAGRIFPLPSGVCSACAEEWAFDSTMLTNALSNDALRTQAELGFFRLRW
jgi:hypothetical protein